MAVFAGWKALLCVFYVVSQSWGSAPDTAIRPSTVPAPLSPRTPGPRPHPSSPSGPERRQGRPSGLLGAQGTGGGSKHPRCHRVGPFDLPAGHSAQHTALGAHVGFIWATTWLRGPHNNPVRWGACPLTAERCGGSPRSPGWNRGQEGRGAPPPDLLPVPSTPARPQKRSRAGARPGRLTSGRGCV